MSARNLALLCSLPKICFSFDTAFLQDSNGPFENQNPISVMPSRRRRLIMRSQGKRSFTARKTPARARKWYPHLEFLEDRVVPSTANMNYVEQTYRDVLQREGEAGGIAFWTAQVDAGQPRTGFAALIDHSDEYFGNIIIKPAHVK